MNTEILVTFLVVGETSSFTRSARRLNLSQSTVSNRIAALENEVRQPLFVRLHDRVELTSAGRALIPYARKITALEHEALRNLDVPSPRERLVIATVHACYDCFLAWGIEEYQRRYANRSIRVVLKHSQEVILGVLDGRYDVGYTHHPMRSVRYGCRKVASDELVLVGSDPGYLQGVTAKELNRLPFIYSGFLDTPVVEELFGKTPCFELEFDIGSKALPYIREGGRISILPRRMVQGALEEGELFAIPLLDFTLPPLEYFVLHSERCLQENCSVRDWLEVGELFFS